MASGQARLSDDRSQVAVAFSLEGVSNSPATVADGLSFFAAAAPLSADIVHRVTETGAEDFVHFAARPDDESLRYQVDVTRVKGLRLVASTLEFLDEGGAPRLRVAPPTLVDADGREVTASLGVEGCSVDTSPRPPWGRPVTAPGSSECTVIVSWAATGARYPVLVDPSWESAGTMTVKRTLHTMTQFASGTGVVDGSSPVLIAGGLDENGAALASAELYQPINGTFAATSPMNHARAAHTATYLNDGRVLLAGGAASLRATWTTTTIPEQLTLVAASTDPNHPPDGKSLEWYSSSDSTWQNVTATLTVPRFYHTATVLNDGRVLLAGGVSNNTNQSTATADLFNPSGDGITATPTMGDRRAGHTATLLTTGNVLLVGGVSDTVLASTALYCAASSAVDLCTSKTAGTFLTNAPGPLQLARAFHTATRLSNGDVIVAGGILQLSNGTVASYTHSAERFDAASGAFVAPISLAESSGRAFHAAVALDNTDYVAGQGGELVLVGGQSAAPDPLASSEAYVGATFSALANLTVGRRHAAALVVAGDSTTGRVVVVTGGNTNSGPTKTAERLFKGLGEECQADGDCNSGHCYTRCDSKPCTGVCCNIACEQDCFSCTADGKRPPQATDLDAGVDSGVDGGADGGAVALTDGGPDGICGVASAGTVVRTTCTLNAGQYFEVHTVCDGQGRVTQGPGTKSCGANQCDSAGVKCIDFCSSDSDCSNGSWCDFGDAGAPEVGDGGPDSGADADTVPGRQGKCKFLYRDSEACSADRQCENKHCVDSVCCNKACDAQCQACNLPYAVGTCTQVSRETAFGEPYPHRNDAGVNPRAACTGEGTACSGYCDRNPTACTYPSNTFYLDGGCSDDPDGGPSILKTYTCNAGNTVETLPTCGGFSCDGTSACKTTCAQDKDCVTNFVCLDGDAGAKVCKALDAPLCDGYATLRKPSWWDAGSTAECPNHLRCPDQADHCLDKCESVNDCVGDAGDYVCNAKGECIERPAPAEISSCSVSPGGAGSSDRWLGVYAGLASLALLLGRRSSVRRMRERG